MDDIPKKPESSNPQTMSISEPSQPDSGWVNEDPKQVAPVVPSEETSVELGAQVQPPDPMQTPPLAQESPANPTPPTPAITPIPGPSSESVIETHGSGGGGKGFKIFVTIGIVVVLAVWAGVAYIFLQNRNLKTQGEQQASQDTPTPTPTPSFSPDQVKIKGGSVIWEKPGGETQVLVDKENYESTGITGFLKVAVSPDNSKLCFESWPPAPEPALYLSGVDGQNVVEASPNRQKCLWSADSKMVYYVNSASLSAPVNIFSYDLATQAETDLTSGSVPSGVVRRYDIVGLSADSTKLICSYEDAGGAASTETVNNCEIDLASGEVTSL